MDRVGFYSATLKPSKEFSWRDINGKLVVINVDSGEYHTFNAVGRTVWLGISEGKRLDEVVDRITDRFGVWPEKAEADIKAFVERLVRDGLLERVT